MSDKIITSPVRERVTWFKSILDTPTHPYFYRVTEPDGYVRYFDSKLEAEDFIREYNGNV